MRNGPCSENKSEPAMSIEQNYSIRFIASLALREKQIQQNLTSEHSGLTSATLEVLACIAFKQPISQAEIDRFFDADKRGRFLSSSKRLPSLESQLAKTGACL
jgi:chromosome segregation and condensation protein ScpB